MGSGGRGRPRPRRAAAAGYQGGGGNYNQGGGNYNQGEGTTTTTKGEAEAVGAAVEEAAHAALNQNYNQGGGGNFNQRGGNYNQNAGGRGGGPVGRGGGRGGRGGGNAKSAMGTIRDRSLDDVASVGYAAKGDESNPPRTPRSRRCGQTVAVALLRRGQDPRQVGAKVDEHARGKELSTSGRGPRAAVAQLKQVRDGRRGEWLQAKAHPRSSTARSRDSPR